MNLVPRPLKIVERYRAKGDQITVVTSNCNYMIGEKIRHEGGWLTEKVENGVRYIRVAAISGYRDSMRRRLLNYSQFALLSLIVGWRASQRENGKTTIMVDISPLFVALAGYFLSHLQARSNLVLEITDLPESDFELEMFNKPFLRRLTDRVFRHIYRRADHIVTLTPGTKKHIEELGISGAKITTVAN
jgi:hypothetical protein